LLEIVPAQDGIDELITLGNKVDCPTEKNLAWKALMAFRNAYEGESPAVKIILDKHLPDGAGMGGGSADASFTLKALNKLHGNPFSDEDLARIALTLGADCPFFVYNRPCFATGIGEVMEPIDLDLSNYWIAIVKPAVSISTKEAFSMITPQSPEKSVNEIVALPIEQWRDVLVNDFERSMFALHPEIESIKEQLYADGAIYASMTGSGSAFFGIFDSEEKAAKACDNSQCTFRCVVRG
jgi:4-diphosphocytidyl-2-C-methyl-D-erythritol kinase